MKYIRRQNFNPGKFLDDTVLQKSDGNVELNPTQRVVINGDLQVHGNIPGPELANVLYVTLDGNDDNTGLGLGALQAKRTLKAACAVAQEGTTIYIKSGEYYEDNPIVVPPRVSIIGDNLRNTILRPLNGPTSVNITNVAKTSEYVTITTDVAHNLTVKQRVRIRSSVSAVNAKDINIFDTPTTTTFRYRQRGANIGSASATGRVLIGTDFFFVNSGDYIAQLVIKHMQAPSYCVNIDSDAIVDTSPYVQNCSNISGPWLRNGTEWLPFQTTQPDLTGTMVTGPRPLMDNEIFAALVSTYGVDTEGSGGGMLIDGDRYSTQSPIKSMIADAFTQVSQGGVGFHITNFGYMQIVSCFNIFADKAYYTTFGGYLSISNSVCDFGDTAFEADGYSLEPYDKGRMHQDYYSIIGSITMSSAGSGFVTPPTVLIQTPTAAGGRRATGTAILDPILGTITGINIDDQGYGYDFTPSITITPANGAAATAFLAKNEFVDIYELANKPQVGSIAIFDGDVNTYYVNKTENLSTPFRYDELKCARDVGIILDSVLADTVFNSNYRANAAGVSYLRSYSSKVTSLQKAQTIAGINKARDLALAYTANATAISRITAGFNTVASIINTGLSAVSVPTFPFTATRTAGFGEAANILTANKLFIQNEITAWINSRYPTFSYDQATCNRDISYIIDAMCYDLTYEGNSQTRQAALAYAAGNVIAGQVEETQAGYEYWQSIVSKIVRNIAIAPSAGNVTAQVTAGSLGSPSPTTGPGVKCEQLLEIIIDVVDHGTGYVPEIETAPSYTVADATLLGIRNTILSNTLTIQNSTVEFLNFTYGGSVRVFFTPSIKSVTNTTRVSFYNVSTVSTASTALEYVGSGITYNALPFFGGEPNATKERVEINSGKCFTVTSDQLGNYRIGQFFNVNAITGEVNIDAEKLNLGGIAGIGPFRRAGIPVGVQLKEVSGNTNLISSTGLQDNNTVPTQLAVSAYVENRYLNKVTTSAETVASTSITFAGDIAVNGGDITTTAATFNLVNTTATTGNLFGAATMIGIGATSGTTTINNPTVVGSQLSVDLWNTTSTTINFAGAATTIGIGASTGTLTLKNATVTTPGQFVTTRANNTATAGGQIYLNGATGNRIEFSNVGLGAPALTTRSVGTKLTVYPNVDGSGVDYGIGMETAAMWLSVHDNTGSFKFYASTTEVARISGTGDVTITGDLAVNGGDITTSATTFNVLNTTATTVNAFGASTATAIGSTVSGTTTIGFDLSVNGDVQVKGGDITTNQTTFNLINATATTVNIAGAGTTVSIGSGTGTATINNANTVIAGDLQVNGGDITTTATTATVFNTNATTVSAFGAATTIGIGASTGTLTIGNQTITGTNATAFNLNGTSPTLASTSTGTLTLFNTNLLTVNAFNAATTATLVNSATTLGIGNTATTAQTVNMFTASTGASTYNFATGATAASTTKIINIGTAGVGTSITTINIGSTVSAATGTTTIGGSTLTASTPTAINLGTSTGALTTVTVGGAITSNILKIAGTTTGTINLTTDVTSGTVNEWQSVTGTIKIGSSGTIQLGTSTSAVTTAQVGGAITGNVLKIAGTAGGTSTLSSDVTTGQIDAFTGITTGTLNLATGGASTTNIGGAANTVNIGTTAGNSTLEVRGNATTGTATIRTNAGVTTANVFNTVATTGNAFGVATAINLGTSAASLSTLTFGPAITGNIVKIGGIAAGTINLTTDVTTGIVNIFTGVTTATTNIVTGGAGTINIGGTGSNVNIKELHLTTPLEVASGGTGLQTITNKGVMYGTGTTAVGVTAASNPGSNATTSYGVLTTNASNIPVWTDVIDGGANAF